MDIMKLKAGATDELTTGIGNMKINEEWRAIKERMISMKNEVEAIQAEVREILTGIKSAETCNNFAKKRKIGTNQIEELKSDLDNLYQTKTTDLQLKQTEYEAMRRELSNVWNEISPEAEELMQPLE